MKHFFNVLKNLTLFIVIAFVCCIFTINTQAKDTEMTFHAIYVGSGDALVLSSQGHYMIVDSGPPENRHLVMDYLSKLDIPDNKIDYVVATHPDGDHVGNFNLIFDKYDIGEVVYSPCTKANTHYSNFIRSVKKEGCTYRNPIEGESWNLGDAVVTVIYDGSKGSTYNECSIVLRVTCGGKSLLLTGDLPATTESLLMTQGYNFQADVLKVGHRGAGSSSSAAFLDAVNPSYAIISSSRKADAILPRDSVLKKLARRFVKVYRTSEKDVVFYFKNGKISTPNIESKKYISISKGTIALTNNVYRSTGKAFNPGVALIVDGKVVPANQYRIYYSSNKYAGFGKVKIVANGTKYLSTCSTTFMILPGQEKSSVVTRDLNSAKLSWNIQKNVTGYYIRYSTDKKFKKNVKYKLVKNQTSTSCNINNLSFNKKYYFSIRAYKTNIGNGKWSKATSLKTAKRPIPDVPTITDFYKTSKYAKISWTKGKSAYKSGYTIQYSTNKKFKKNIVEKIIKNNKKTTFKTVKGKKHRSYYFRVKGYNRYGSGKWSKTFKYYL